MDYAKMMGIDLEVIHIDELKSGQIPPLFWVMDAHKDFITEAGVDSIEGIKRIAELEFIRAKTVLFGFEYATAKKKRVIFDLANENIDVLRLRNMEVLKKDASSFVFSPHNSDPSFIIGNLELEDHKVYVVDVVIHSPENTFFQLFHSDKRDKKTRFTERDSTRIKIKKGVNHLRVPLLNEQLGKDLRVDPGIHEGEYNIADFKIEEYLYCSGLMQQGSYVRKKIPIAQGWVYSRLSPMRTTFTPGRSVM
jgi:hypothetical protein